MIQGILLHYPTYPADFGFEAYYEVEDLLAVLSNKFNVWNGRISIAPDGMKGLLLIDLRNTPISHQNEGKFQRFCKQTLQKGKNEEYWERITKPLFFNALVKSRVDEIANTTKQLKDRIKGKWRIKLRTRHRIPRRETIEKAAKPIQHPVDLENPEYIVRIECMGELSGIGVEEP